MTGQDTAADGVVPAPGPGVRVAVDVGSVRVGVAASDPAGVLASPVETLARGGGDLDRLAAIVEERKAVEVLVGLPRTLAGREGPSVTMARSYADAVGRRIAPVPVRLVDERLTTVVAERQLRSGGRRGGARARRAVVDQVAAVAILQSWLDRPGDRTPDQPVGPGTAQA